MYNIYSATKHAKDKPQQTQVGREEIKFKPQLQLKKEKLLSSLVKLAAMLSCLRCCLDLPDNRVQLLCEVSSRRSLPGLGVPAALHQLPPLWGKLGKALRTKASLDGTPETLLVGALAEVLWQLLLVGADVPVKDAKGIDVN